MTPCQYIDYLSPNWEIVSVCSYGIVKAKNGLANFQAGHQFNLMRVDVRRYAFVINDHYSMVTVRSVLFLNQGPFIQLWRDQEFPKVRARDPVGQRISSESVDPDVLIDDFTLQDGYYRSVKIGKDWFRLANYEQIMIVNLPQSLINDKEVITGVNLDIFNCFTNETIIEFSVP